MVVMPSLAGVSAQALASVSTYTTMFDSVDLLPTPLLSQEDIQRALRVHEIHRDVSIYLEIYFHGNLP